MGRRERLRTARRMVEGTRGCYCPDGWPQKYHAIWLHLGPCPAADDPKEAEIERLRVMAADFAKLQEVFYYLHSELKVVPGEELVSYVRELREAARAVLAAGKGQYTGYFAEPLRRLAEAVGEEK